MTQPEVGRPVGSRAIELAILEAVIARGAGKSVCPSEIARALADDWRPWMAPIWKVAQDLADRGQLRITQKGRAVDATRARGPIRMSLPEPQDPG